MVIEVVEVFGRRNLLKLIILLAGAHQALEFPVCVRGRRGKIRGISEREPQEDFTRDVAVLLLLPIRTLRQSFRLESVPFGLRVQSVVVFETLCFPTGA